MRAHCELECEIYRFYLALAKLWNFFLGFQLEFKLSFCVCENAFFNLKLCISLAVASHILLQCNAACNGHPYLVSHSKSMLEYMQTRLFSFFNRIVHCFSWFMRRLGLFGVACAGTHVRVKAAWVFRMNNGEYMRTSLSARVCVCALCFGVRHSKCTSTV